MCCWSLQNEDRGEHKKDRGSAVPLFLKLAGTLIYKHFIFSLFLTLPLFLIHQTFDNSFAKTEDIFLHYFFYWINRI